MINNYNNQIKKKQINKFNFLNQISILQSNIFYIKFVRILKISVINMKINQYKFKKVSIIKIIVFKQVLKEIKKLMALLKIKKLLIAIKYPII